MKWAINGFGRIGRGILRTAIKQNMLDRIVAIHDYVPVDVSAHLTKYDSIFGPLSLPVSHDNEHLIIGDRAIPYFYQLKDHTYPWSSLEVDVVLECTGVMTQRSECQKHRDAGAKRVLISAPSKDEDVKTIVYGVNHDTFNPDEDWVISNASCTTNCLAPLAQVIHQNFHIVRGLMTTVHSYTNDQRILDTAHKDLRRARAGAINMIPTTTGAAKAVGKVLPDLKGKIDGFALRVPTPNVSFVDFVAELKREATVDRINEVLQKASQSHLKHILAITTDPVVSTDMLGSSYSSIVDANLTMCLDKTLIKACSWYDNEYGFCHRMLDMASLMTTPS